MNKRKTDTQAAKEAQRMYKRRKYAEMKADPLLYERQKEKEREKYRKKKEKGQVASINEKSPREIRAQRKRWREASKNYRLKKKEESKIQSIPPSVFIEAKECDVDNDSEGKEIKKLDPLQRPESTVIRKIRYIEQKKRKILQNYIIQLKKKNAALEKKIKLLTKEKEILQKLPKKKETLKHTLSEEPKEDRRTNVALVRLVQLFYTDDSNSTIGAGKKEYISRNKIQKQKRYLNFPLKTLYQKFLASHTVKISYGFFCKHRPFWVLLPKQKNRDTCMCMIHCNIDLLVDSLYKASIIPLKNSQELLANVCCSFRNEDCLSRKCLICQHKIVMPTGEFSNDVILNYHQWVRNRETMVTKKGSKVQTTTTKKDFSGPPVEILQKLNDQLPTFIKHSYNVQTQYVNLRKLKETMAVNEALIHVDFSENYSLKFGTEVQSFHFGGSRKEVSLHTAVIYTFDFHRSAVGSTCVCTISPCLRHDASAIWAHLVPLINVTIATNPFIDTIHFQSDSPTSQYRNKYMFYMITQLWKEFHNIKKITWNYTEAGHGKGAPDGVGAVLKRTSDTLVKCGHDIGTFDQFMKCIQENIENIKIIQVSEENIQDKERQLPSNLKPFSGTLSVHQVLWERYSNHLTFRKTSCFVCDVGNICEHGKHYDIVTLASTRPVLSNISNIALPSTSRIVTFAGKQAANIVFKRQND